MAPPVCTLGWLPLGPTLCFSFLTSHPPPPAPPAETMVAPAQLVSWPLLLPLHLSSFNSHQSCPHTDLTIAVFSNPPVASCLPQSKVQT